MGEVIYPIWGQKKHYTLHLVDSSVQATETEEEKDWRCTKCGVDLGRDSADKDFWRYNRYVIEPRGHRNSTDGRYISCDKDQQKLL